MDFLLQVPIRFRLCREDDLPALEWMGLHTREREIIAAVFAGQQRGEALMLLAEARGFPVAQVWFDFVERGSSVCPRLWAIRVFPPLQGGGLGRRLMVEAESRAARRGARWVELAVERSNVSASRFYARLGYVAVGEEPEVLARNSQDAVVVETDALLVRRKLLRPAVTTAQLRRIA